MVNFRKILNNQYVKITLYGYIAVLLARIVSVIIIDTQVEENFTVPLIIGTLISMLLMSVMLGFIYSISPGGVAKLVVALVSIWSVGNVGYQISSMALYLQK